MKNKGFSLIEVMVSLAIFSVSILGIMAFQIIAIQANQNARRLTSATVMGQSLSDDLAGLPFTAPKLTAGNHPLSGELWLGQDIFTNNVDETVSVIYTRGTTLGYQVSWSVTDTNAILKAITVNIQWLEPQSTSHSVRFFTYRTLGTYD